jgi:hypothetical protein
MRQSSQGTARITARTRGRKPTQLRYLCALALRKKGTAEVVARELYDHRTDSHEDVNVATEAKNKDEVDRHAKLLAGGWKANTPP